MPRFSVHPAAARLWLPLGVLSVLLLETHDAVAAPCPALAGCVLTKDYGPETNSHSSGAVCGPWGAWGAWGPKSGICNEVQARLRFRMCSETTVTATLHRCGYVCPNPSPPPLSMEVFKTHEHAAGSVTRNWREEDKDLKWFDPPDHLWDETEVYCDPSIRQHYRAQYTIEGAWIDALPGVASHTFTLDGGPMVEDQPFDFTPYGPGHHVLHLIVTYDDASQREWNIHATMLAISPWRRSIQPRASTMTGL